MFFTIFCCVSTALSLYCILKRFNKRTVELAVHASSYQVKKEMYERYTALAKQLATKELELNRMREKLKLHEAVPAHRVPVVKTPAAAADALPGKKKARQGLELFEMTAPFTETSYNDLLRATEVVKVEPVGM
jgi:hypothetical protein